MKQSVLKTLSEKDYVLWRETKKDSLKGLDEDELIELHVRIRRARNKHSTNYRRGAAGRVDKTGSRGGARSGNQKARDRAEAMEDALARVSRRLSVVAQQSANTLRDERLAAARKGSGGGAGGKRSPGPAKGAVDRQEDRRLTRTPSRQKRVAGSAAAGARRQARKDNR